MQALPDDASLEDAMERLFLLAKIERGLQQADAGELIPHEKVKERIAESTVHHGARLLDPKRLRQ